MLVFLSAACFFVVDACSSGEAQYDDDDNDDNDDSSSDSDSDSDTDTDSDTDSDTDTDTDTGPPGDEPIGTPCVPPEEDEDDPCPGLTGISDAFCFAWTDAPGGICTKSCTAATYDAPVQSGCPTFDGVVCMDISDLTADTSDDATGYEICVEECVPSPLGESGPCIADYIACDPQSWAWESQFATCLMPKCQSSADCLVATGIECSGDTDCNTAEGAYCSDDDNCVFEADCDLASGRCTWTAGDPTSEPGDPCESTWDCGENHICFVEDIDDDDKVAPANGYCAKFGCKAANEDSPNGSGSSDAAIQDEFGCGFTGVCHAGFQMGGLCMKRCLPPHGNPAMRCRQQSWEDAPEFLDAHGDYDCYDQTAYGFYIYTSGNTEFYPVADDPFCTYVMRGVGAKCGTASDEKTPSDCDDHFSGGLSLGMTCRDPVTGESDLYGYCLDETTSGETEAW
jgi:hypothetical protein